MADKNSRIVHYSRDNDKLSALKYDCCGSNYRSSNVKLHSFRAKFIAVNCEHSVELKIK
jgi:hypothetical protein